MTDTCWHCNAKPGEKHHRECPAYGKPIAAVVSSSPDIPDEAVEAAARAVYEKSLSRGWDTLVDDGKETWRRIARAALVAAYPALTRQAVEHFLDTVQRGDEPDDWQHGWWAGWNAKHGDGDIERQRDEIRAAERERIATAIEAAYEEWRAAGDESLPDAPLMHSTQWFVERTYLDAARIARAEPDPT